MIEVRTRMRNAVGRDSRSAIFLAAVAAASKVLGLVRETGMAWAFGTSAVVDAYRIGSTFATYFSHLFFGDAMTIALVPLLARRKDGGTAAEEAVAMERAVLGGTILISAPIGLLLVVFPGTALDLFAPGLAPASRVWTIAFVRVFGFAIPLYSLAAIVVMIRQAEGNYRALGLRPVGQNLFLILGIGAAVVLKQPILLAVSFAAYYAALLAAVDAKPLLALARSTGIATLRPLASLMGRWLPIAASLMVLRANAMVERYFGSGLPTGSIAALDYARFVTEVPTLLIAVPVGTVLLTAIGKRGADASLTRGQRQKLRYVTALLLLVSAGMVLLAHPITVVIFARGAFDSHSVEFTVAAMRGLGAGAWALAASQILSRIIIATGSSRWALLLPSLASLAANVFFARALTPRYGVGGLALATSLASVVFVFGCAAQALRARIAPADAQVVNTAPIIIDD